MSILLLSCYELGHQPLSLAWPLAFLEEAGLAATAVDLSLSPFPETEAENAAFVGIAVPMHTALRLGVAAARRVRAANPAAHICFYGLYAWLNRNYLLGEGLADSVLAGEVEPSLTAQVQAVLAGEQVTAVSHPILSRQPFPIPQRAPLPDLGN
ncbi:MAG: radical SAM protein, partial [Anaerolineae bacterium]